MAKDPSKAALRGAIAFFVVSLIVTFYLLPTASPDPVARDTATEWTAAEQEARRRELDERRTLAEARLAVFTSEAQAVLEQNEALKAEIDRWEREIVPLATNDAGRALAAHETFVTAYAEQYPRVQISEFQTLTKNVHSTVTALLKNAAAPGKTVYIPADNTFEVLRRYANDVQEAHNELSAARALIQGMVDAAQADGNMHKLTLNEAIAEQQRQQAVEQAEAIQKAIAAKQAEVTQRRQRLETAKLEAGIRKAEAEAAMEKLKREAQRPDVQARFAPILAHGFYQPDASRSKGIQTERPGPMSYTRLQSYGALDAGENGFLQFTTLCLVHNIRSRGTSYNLRSTVPASNDRPKLPVPRNNQQLLQLRNMHREFLRLVPAFRELGLLAP